MHSPRGHGKRTHSHRTARTEGLASTCRAILHCRTDHRGLKSMTERFMCAAQCLRFIVQCLDPLLGCVLRGVVTPPVSGRGTGVDFETMLSSDIGKFLFLWCALPWNSFWSILRRVRGTPVSCSRGCGPDGVCLTGTRRIPSNGSTTLFARIGTGRCYTRKSTTGLIIEFSDDVIKALASVPLFAT